MKIESVTTQEGNFSVIRIGENEYLPLLLESFDIDNDVIYGSINITEPEEIELFGSRMVTIRKFEKKGRVKTKNFIVKTAYGNELIFKPVTFDELIKRYN